MGICIFFKKLDKVYFPLSEKRDGEIGIQKIEK